MNAIAHFRKCTLSNDALLRRVDEGTDNLYKSREIPSRHIPARPDHDYDLLVGELVLRFQELEAENKRLRELIQEAEAWLSFNMRPDAAQITNFRKSLQKALNPPTP